jgi:hypothetical protein
MIGKETIRLKAKMRRLFLFAAFTSLVAPLFAQAPINTTQRKRQRGPRAIAVIRWQADQQGNGHPVLLPVTVRDEGKIFDAAVYKTSPRPMAIEPDTVYEAQQHGQPWGLFTIVSTTRENNDDRTWVGLGRFQVTASEEQVAQKDVHQANVIIGTPKAQSPNMPDVPEGEQKRKTTQVYDESGRPIDNSTDDEPPTLSKGKREPVERSPRVSPPEKKPAPPPTSTNPDDDPDRPRLKKGPSSTSSAKPVPTQPDNDPNRPILKRGRPNSVTRISNPAENTPIPREVISRASVNRPRVYEVVAVSDADQTLSPANYNFNATLAERQGYLRKMEELVDQELKPKAAAAPKITLRKAAPPAPSRFADVRFEVLDLDSNNSPEIVLTGSYVLSATSRTPFVLVARGDYEGNPRTLMFAKGDKFEFIDAVDVEGDGPGELLFRKAAQNGGSTFVIYRATPDGLNEIFKGGAAD